MNARVAVGVGCRLGCPADAIETLVMQALNQAMAVEVIGLFTINVKSGEAGLIKAAERLGFDLVFLSRADLQAQAPRVQTRSARVQSLFGVPSVAEAAALAGAGAGAVLIVPRTTGRGAACAVAEARGHVS